MTIKRNYSATCRLVLVVLAIGAIAVVVLSPTQAWAQTGAEAASDSSSVSLLQTFFIQRNPRTGQVEILGSLIVWLLLAMSVASIAMIGVFTRENKREVILPASLVMEVKTSVRKGGRASNLRIADDDSSHLGTILRAALCEKEFGQEAMQRAHERACEEDTAERLRRVETLNIIGSVAPMIGLFGTVYGMILAFSEIVASGGSPDPVGLAAGIGTALTTTFWGLVVAIPALAGYAFIRNNIDAVTSEASLLVDDFINRMRDSADDSPGERTSHETHQA